MIGLLLAMVVLAHAVQMKDFDQLNTKFQRLSRESEECDTYFCRVRVNRHAAAAFREMEAKGDELEKKHQEALKSCKHRDCQTLALKSSLAFCQRAVKSLRKAAKFLHGTCGTNRRCRRRYHRKTRRYASYKCIQKVPKLKKSEEKKEETKKEDEKEEEKKEKEEKKEEEKKGEKKEEKGEKKEEKGEKKEEKGEKKEEKGEKEEKKEHFSKCQKRLRAAWAKEYLKRSKEHQKMSELHDRGSKCTSHACTRGVERQRKTLASKIALSRHARRVRLKKLACKKKAKTPEKKEEKPKKPDATLGPIDTSTCAGKSAHINLMLEDAYRRSNDCKTHACRRALNSNIHDLRLRLADLGECHSMEDEDDEDDEGEKPVIDTEASEKKGEKKSEEKKSEEEKSEEKKSEEKKSEEKKSEEKKSEEKKSEEKKSEEKKSEEKKPEEKSEEKSGEKKSEEKSELSEEEPAEEHDEPSEGEIKKELKTAEKQKEVEDAEKAALKKKKTCQHGHRDLAELNRQLAFLYKELSKCGDKGCKTGAVMAIKKLKEDIARVSNLPMCKYDHKKFAGAARDEYDAKSKHYFNKLRTVLAQCESRTCRRSVFKKYRSDLESRQLALFRQLTDQAKAKVEADVKACKARKWNKEKEEVCIKTIKKWEKDRMDTLRIRELQLDKRRELRLCAVTADPEECRAAVRKEYERDVKKIRNHEQADEKDTVESVERSARSSSASKVAYTVVAVALALAVALI